MAYSSAAVNASLATSFGLIVYFANRLLYTKPPVPFPPGPKGWPLIGNVLDWPKEKESETFTEWGKRYGDIVHCDLLGQHIFIVNSPDLAFEMLEKKGAIYSSRPSMYVGCELVGWKNTPVMAPYGDYWRTMRKMLIKEIGSKATIERFQPMQMREVHKFICRALDRPAWELLSAHVRKLSASVILSASYGYPVREGDDPIVNLGERSMADGDAILMAGAYLVDVFPIIDRLPGWFPAMAYRKIAAKARTNSLEYQYVPYMWVKEQLAQGTAQPSFVATHLEGRETDAEEDDMISATASSFFGAGSETSICAIYAFFLAMTLHPEVQTHAQAEIDSVLGTDRLPSMADREQLPYVEAICKEVVRWATPVPLGVPHALTEDDVHRGYFIPKGSYILTNLAYFTHNPKEYRDPETFNPSRFLPEDGGEPERDPRDYIFGFGRRVCPGALLFGATFFITCATTLATLDIQKEVDMNGQVVEPEVDFVAGLVAHPKPFRCSLRARSAKAEALVRDHAEALA